MSKYGHRTINWFESIVNKLGGEEAAESFLRGELLVSKPIRSWREENGVIYFNITSDGTTGEDWIKRLEDNGFRVGEYAKWILCSPDFKPTRGVTTEIAILKGTLFKDDDRITQNILFEADKRKFSKPNAEVSCLVREKFTDKEIEAMGLIWLVVMHEPINDSQGDSSLLGARCYDGGRWLRAYDDEPSRHWQNESGFVFAVSQNSN